MTLKNTIFYKNLQALYKLNLDSTNEVHKTVVSALFNVFVMMRGDIDQAKLEMCLSTASGDWLDVWGDYFSVPRMVSESDIGYSTRIIQEVISPKVTVPALKKATATWLNREYGESFTDNDVSIVEPWKYLLIPSQRGTLSGESKLWSPDYWTYGVIDIALPNPSQFSLELVSYLSAVKAAGVKIEWSVRPSWDLVISHWDSDNVYVSRTAIMSLLIELAYKAEVLDLTNLVSDSPDVKVSGNQLIWSDCVSHYRDTNGVYFPIRLYESSSVTRLSDLSTLLNKAYEETTINDVIELELLDDQYIQDGGCIIKSSLGSIQISSMNLTQVNIGLVNNIRYYGDSPIISSLIKQGFIWTVPYSYKTEYTTILTRLFEHYPDKTLDTITFQDILEFKNNYQGIVQSPGDFIYDDPDKNFYSWLSLKHISDVVGVSPDILSLEDMSTDVVSIINALIKEESIVFNVLAPVQITSIPI